ncbi:MAG TPA: hypothetical protein VFI16_08825 [Anaeromyxobacteraceae bacterium]|nr:hypothetical protein [Anaeromyxobacteraceae bacterium]
MTRAAAAAALEGTWRWAVRLALWFAIYLFAMGFAAGWGLPQVAASPAGAALALGAAGLLVLSAAAPLLAPGPLARRAGTTLLRAGLALSLVAPAASLALRRDFNRLAGEGQALGPEHVPGLPPMRFGEVRVAPQGTNPLLSKTVTIEAFFRDEAEPVPIGLYPPTFAGGWRLSVLKYGYGPAVRWTAPGGRTLVEGYVPLGTLPRGEEESRLVAWSPEPNVMMGVGTFPPRTEELVSPPGTGMHLFLRIDEASVGGVRRDLRGPDSWRFLLQGRIEHPLYFVQAFRGKEKVFEGRLPAGASAEVAGGRLTLPDEVAMWVELIAVWDPWIYLGLAGLLALAAGGALRLHARRAARRVPARP